MTALLAVVFAFTGCDEEFTEVGGEIITNPSNVELREVEVKAYSQKINSVQTNNLPNNVLGVTNNPVYGQGAASIVSQLTLSTEDPDFGDNPVLDSVVLTIPYFSRQSEASTAQEIVYELDSIYGSESFKLSIYETSYFLNDYDPEVGFEQRQKYYSDQQEQVEQNIVGEPLFVEDEFKPSPLPFTTYEINAEGENDTIANAPALRIKLPVDYFQEKILDKAGSSELLNNGNFRNYIRSLLIKAEPNGSGGSQVLLNFADQNSPSRISLYYKRDLEVDGETERVRTRFNLGVGSGSNRFNTFTGEFPEGVSQAIAGQTAEMGAENLYLKAQEGSMAVIELFPDEDELEAIRAEELLVNEANLTFYVNDDLVSGDEPRRLYLYDLNNNRFLFDYGVDISYRGGNPDNSLINFSQPVAEDENGRFYTLRITNHVSGIINEGDDNVKLGLVIVPNINAVAARDQQGNVVGSVMSSVRNTPGPVEQIPSVNSLTPTGTILYGNMADDVDKRLKLKIYYTNYN
ncbi:DUF4270 domain-containing protein [Pontixanthobacter gangjinensis]